MPNRYYRLTKLFIRSAAVGGIGVENGCEGIKLTSHASSLQKVERGVFHNYTVR